MRRECFPPPPLVSDPNMHHGTCVTHVPWCILGSLTSGFLWSRWRGKTFPAFQAHAQPILPIWQEAHVKVWINACMEASRVQLIYPISSVCIVWSINIVLKCSCVTYSYHHVSTDFRRNYQQYWSVWWRHRTNTCMAMHGKMNTSFPSQRNEIILLGQIVARYRHCDVIRDIKRQVIKLMTSNAGYMSIPNGCQPIRSERRYWILTSLIDI